MGCLSNPGTTVPLLLHNLVAVTMIVLAVQCPYLLCMRGSVPVAGQPIQLAGSRQLLWGRRRLGWFGRFELFPSRSLFSFLSGNPLPVFQVPPVFGFFDFLRITIRHVSMATDVWSERRSISKPLSTNH